MPCGPNSCSPKTCARCCSYVETGNADAGIVYATDARISQKVRVVAVAPPGSHTPVIYPAAVIKGSPHPAEARAFLEFLTTPAVARLFSEHGFTVAGYPSAAP